jgi:hypothetical protein
MHHRLAAPVLMTILLAGCTGEAAPSQAGQASAVSTPASTTATVPAPTTAVAASSPSVAPTTAPTPGPSFTPLAALAPELAGIAWAAYDREAGMISAGLLGQPASYHRSTADFGPSPNSIVATVRPSGPFLLIHPPTADLEIIDIRTGREVARLDIEAKGYSSSFSHLDPTGTYLYVRVEEDRALKEIRRIRTDGSEDVRFALLDTVRDGEHWSGTFALAPDGSTVVLTCPDQGHDSGSNATGRCRLSHAESGAEPGFGMRLLQASMPHPCGIVGAGLTHIVLGTAEYCNADGGMQPVRYLGIRYADGTYALIDETRGLDQKGILEIDGQPFLIADNQGARDEEDMQRWPYDETVRQSLASGKVRALVPESRSDDPEMQWFGDRIIGNDIIVLGLGSGYIACREAAPDPFDIDCSPDAAAIWNPDLGRFIPLPIDTYGNENSLWY